MVNYNKISNNNEAICYVEIATVAEFAEKAMKSIENGYTFTAKSELEYALALLKKTLSEN